MEACVELLSLEDLNNNSRCPRLVGQKMEENRENRRGGVLNAAGIGGAMAGTPGAAPRLAMLSLDHLVLAARRSNLQPSEGRPRNHYECVGTTVDS